MEYTSKEFYEYISKQLNDPIVEWKVCRVSWQEFPIYQSDLEFYDKVSPSFEVDEEYVKEFLKNNDDIKNSFKYEWWKLKVKLQSPTLCPEERYRRRLSFSNLCNLYKRKDSGSWKWVISIYSPDKSYIVYDYNFWNTYSWPVVEKDANWDFSENYQYLIDLT